MEEGSMASEAEASNRSGKRGALASPGPRMEDVSSGRRAGAVDGDVSFALEDVPGVDGVIVDISGKVWVSTGLKSRLRYVS